MVQFSEVEIIFNRTKALSYQSKILKRNRNLNYSSSSNSTAMRKEGTHVTSALSQLYPVNTAVIQYSYEQIVNLQVSCFEIGANSLLYMRDCMIASIIDKKSVNDEIDRANNLKNHAKLKAIIDN